MATTSTRRRPEYQFIFLEGKSRVEDKATRTRIKQHVMRDIGQRRRRSQKPSSASISPASTPPSNASASSAVSSASSSVISSRDTPPILSDVGPPGESTASTRARVQSHEEEYDDSSRLLPVSVGGADPIVAGFIEGTEMDGAQSVFGTLPSPVVRLGSGQQDPFSPYPVEMTASLYRVMQHMLGESLPPRLRVYRDVWLPASINDAAAFHQILASYGLHLKEEQSNHHSHTDLEIINNHLAAMTLVRERLAKPRSSQSDGLLVAMIALACYAHLSRDLERWQVHMSAVEDWIKTASGTAIISRNRQVANLLEWVEIIGCYVLDLQPRFTGPSLEAANGHEDAELRECGALLPLLGRSSPLWRAVHELEQFNDRLRLLHSIPGHHVWDNPALMGQTVNRIARELLNSRSSAGECLPLAANVTQMCVRSGALLYLAELRRRCGNSPVIASLHVERLRKLLTAANRIGAQIPDPVQLWLTTVGAIEAVSTSHQSFFYSRLSDLTVERLLYTQHDVEAALSDCLWLNSIYGPRLTQVLTCVFASDRQSVTAAP